MTPTNGAIATPHRLATRAGELAFRSGGTAVDAALAAAATLAVVYPHNTGIGGDLVAIVRDPDGRLHGVNATGWGAERESLEQLVDRYGAEIPRRGVGPITVPGALRGWAVLAEVGARLGRSAHLGTAIEAARDGVTVSSSLAMCLAAEWATLDDPDARAALGIEDRPLRRGERLMQPALARTLELLERDGFDAFYEGELADEVVSGLAAKGARFTAQDFASFAADRTDPIGIDWRGLRVSTLGPNTQGFGLLRAAAALDTSEREAPELIARLFSEANHLRDTALGDPRHAPVDIAPLVHGDVDLPEPATVPDPRLARGDTIGIAAADAEGWAVSLVQSQFHLFGSGVYDPGTGILFHNRGYSFSLDAAAPGRFGPRVRPAHTLMPVVVTDAAGEPAFVQATMGGKAQAQIHTQLLLRLAGGASAAEAVAAPRWTVGAYAPGDRSDSVYAEADVPDEVVARLHDEGYPIVTVPPLTEMLGHSNVVRRVGTGFDAAADPRSDGAAYVAAPAEGEDLEGAEAVQRAG
ncbi:gamma-glutamyltranspeptidase [Pseudoclavibacter endophyticus]|nr:gamma-glutamyltransferase [Pseudoclavibacter endophyticus]GGA70187.1 gamma-glutamyltranspeptidase [Pseudoclavibacter endophyticus]